MPTDFDAKKLREYLQERRLNAGLSVAALARTAEMKPETIADIEKGRTGPHIGTLKRIVEALGGSMDDLRRHVPRKGNGSIAAGRWPHRLFICRSVELAAQLAARRVLRLIAQQSGSNVILPTHRTAMTVFDAMLRMPAELTPGLTAQHYFIDTESLGLPPDHSLSRHRAVKRSFIGPLADSGFAIPPTAVHFFEGVMPEAGFPFAAMNGELRTRPTLVSLTSVSPSGEMSGYSPGIYSQEGVIGDGCHIVYRNEEDKSYVDANLPSRATLTLGLGNILQAYELMVLIIHPQKQRILSDMLHGEADPAVPATLLRRHSNVSVITTAQLCQPKSYPAAVQVNSAADAERAARPDDD